MFKSLVCGSNFGEEGDDKPQVPRRRRKHVFSIRRKDRNVENPYSSYGLDKLASLVADLREKREKISTKNRGMVLVRSVHTSRDALVPVVVKGTNRNNREEAKEGGDSVSDKHVILTDRSTSSEESSPATGEGQKAKTPVDGSKKASFMSGEAEQGSYAAAAVAVVILILIMLAFFGRPVVILWSSMAWYIVPALRGTRSTSPNLTETVAKAAKQRYDEKPVSPRNPCLKPLSCSSSFTSRINISQLPLKDLML